MWTAGLILGAFVAGVAFGDNIKAWVKEKASSKGKALLNKVLGPIGMGF